jgi:hypothetical protein
MSDVLTIQFGTVPLHSHLGRRREAIIATDPQWALLEPMNRR